MKKILSAIVSLTMLIGTLPIINASAATTSLEGSGTSADPYKISSKADLEFMRDEVNKGGMSVTWYELTADIDLENEEWTPIGSETSTLFRGSFNGNNHVIKNFKLTQTSGSYVGLFGVTDFNASITNLGIENAQINVGAKSSAANIGILAGYVYGGTSGAISDCYVKNSSVISENNYWGNTGGFIGGVRSGAKFSNCYVYGVTISEGNSAANVGGFIGALMNSGISSELVYCYVGNVTINNNNAATIYPVACKSGSATEYSGNIIASSLTPVNGSYRPSQQSYNKDFSTSRSIGGESCTYEAIVAKMADGESHFKVDKDINGGWPCLVTENTVVTALKGSGTDIDPYQISSSKELIFARDKINAFDSETEGDGQGEANNPKYRVASYVLTADIDLGGIDWEPIGSIAGRTSQSTGKVDSDLTRFRGKFDGNGHVVKNFKAKDATNSKNSTGFFGATGSNVEIKNLGIENATIRGEGEKGGMVGNGSGTFENCFVRNSTIQSDRGDIYGGNMAGFIGGIREISTFKNCYVYNVTLCSGVVYAAGFGIPAQTAGKVTFENCYTAEITAKDASNGKPAIYPFVNGRNDGDKTKYVITNSYAADAPSNGVNKETAADRIANADTKVNYDSTEDPTAEVCNKAKNDIVSALSTAGYKSDSINGGYPSLSWETMKVDDVMPYMVSSVAPGVGKLNIFDASGNLTTGFDDEIKVKVETTEADADAKVYVAAYDLDGRLIDAYKGAATVNTEIATGVSSTDAVTIKVFVWDKNNTPIADAYIGEPQLTRQLKQYVTVKGSDGKGEYVPNVKTRLITIGDSIMDSVNNSVGDQYSWEKTGWELYMPELLNDDIDVIKHGHSGWSIGNFMMGSAAAQHCNWSIIKGQFRKGDYIILALGINDDWRIEEYNKAKATAEAAGKEFDDNGGVNPSNNRIWFSQEQFKEMYKTLISEARAKGATVILTTPTPEASATEYVAANVHPYTKPIIEEVARETNTPLIDVTSSFCDILNGYVEDGTYTYDQIRPQYDSSNNMIAPGVIYTDYVHMTDFGARLIATIVTNALKTMDTGIEQYIKTDYTVMPNPLPTLN